MRIERLYLKNFAHILSGLGKYEIDLNLRGNHKLINLIIGKMGSCKTVILGHLQPFSNFGTLDSRNQDDIVIKEKNGLKILEITDGDDSYVVKHDYRWKKDHHMIKSFIEKNGVELNPSGSVTNFRSIVELELGIDPEFLVLLRLGANVTNIIDKKATDRKAYMASRLSEADMYVTLYKKLNDDMRSLNAQATMLMKKISTLSRGDLSALEKRFEEITDTMHGLTDEKEHLLQLKYKITADINGQLENSTIDTIRNERLAHIREVELLKNNLDSINESIDSAQTANMSISEVARNIGAVEAKLSGNSIEQVKLEDAFKESQKMLDDLREKLLVRGDEDQINRIRDTYTQIMASIAEMKRDITDFDVKYDSVSLNRFMGHIDSINVLLSDMHEYNSDDVLLVLRKGADAVKAAMKKIDILNAQRYKLQTNVDNFKYASAYRPTEVLFVPPFCPTEDCPYYKTHPATLQKETDLKRMDELFIQVKAQIDEIDNQIQRYSAFTLIFNKLSILQSTWYAVINQLSEIGVVKTTVLTKVLQLNLHSTWYDYDKLVQIRALAEEREKYYELTERANSLKSELDQYNCNDRDAIQMQIQTQETKMREILQRLHEIDSENHALDEEKMRFNHIYISLEKYSEMEKDRDLLISQIDDLNSKISKCEEIDRQVSELRQKAMVVEASISEVETKLKKVSSDHQFVQMTLNDIDYAKKDFDEIRTKQETLRYIVDAVSPSKGIPLVFIKLFLQECREDLNDLISDVFGDSIEVLDFNIKENEFTIPYSVNGTVVDDISKASQGQKSIISMALSFAMLRQAHSKWNIMLLDEMDGPLYKDDRNKFISILYKQLSAIQAEQVFLISHNFSFDGQSANVIMTTDEHVDKNAMTTVMHI